MSNLDHSVQVFLRTKSYMKMRHILCLALHIYMCKYGWKIFKLTWWNRNYYIESSSHFFSCFSINQIGKIMRVFCITFETHYIILNELRAMFLNFKRAGARYKNLKEYVACLLFIFSEHVPYYPLNNSNCRLFQKLVWHLEHSVFLRLLRYFTLSSGNKDLSSRED